MYFFSKKAPARITRRTAQKLCPAGKFRANKKSPHEGGLFG